MSAAAASLSLVSWPLSAASLSNSSRSGSPAVLLPALVPAGAAPAAAVLDAMSRVAALSSVRARRRTGSSAAILAAACTCIMW